jgi:hypothetical protein
MRLIMRVPIFTRSGSDELDHRRQELNTWFHGSSGRTMLKERYGFEAIDRLAVGPLQGLELRTGDQMIFIKYPDDLRALVPKGLLLRLELLHALQATDQRGIDYRNDTIFVMIDGSGAFDYRNTFQLLDRLLSPPYCEVVLGVRPPDQSGMPDWRKSIEKFEEFVLRTHLEMEHFFPDSQAGCWALRLSALKRLPLTAPSYEIEWDLLACAHLNQVRTDFVGPLQMAQRRTSELGGGEIDRATARANAGKLRFIRHKLDYTDEEVLELLDDYLAQGGTLPQIYIDEVRLLFTSHRVV